MVEIIGRDRQNLKEFQTDVNRDMLAEVIWRNSKEAWRTWWFLYEGVLISPQPDKLPHVVGQNR